MKLGEPGVYAPFIFFQNKEKKEIERQKNKYLFYEEAIIKLASRSKSYSSYSKISHVPLNWKSNFTGPAGQILW